MSDFDWDDDDSFEDAQGESTAMKELRKAYREMKKQNKELQESLNGMKTSVRERSVKDVLASKGLPEKISKFIPEDVTSAEEVEAWVAEYGDVFGAKPTATETQEHDPQVDSFNRMSQAINTAQAAPAKIEDLRNAVANAKTRAELDALTGNLVSDGRRL